MSKKFKKKIEDLCGLVNLDWEARQERAEQILCNSDWKQQLCNDLQGLSFRDLELYLQGVAAERQKKEESNELKSAKSDNEKPMRRGSNKSTSSPAVRPRTLSEILEQVYAPRVDLECISPEERQALRFGTKKESSDVFPDAPDDNDQTGR